MTVAPTLAVVFARGGSTEVPRKNLREVGGAPLVGRAVRAALDCGLIDRVLVSTDDREIAEVARTFGAEVPWMRPAALASADAPEWAAWQHALAMVAEEGRAPGMFVSVPPTAPLRTSSDLRDTIDHFRGGDYDVVLTGVPARRHPSFNMVRLDDTGRVTLAEPGGTEVRRQDVAPLYDVTTVAYVADPGFVSTATRIFDGRVGLHVVSERSGWDVDTEFDLEVAQRLAQQEAR
jgi:N-acylneuraminate cytidylyltransferase